MSPTSPSGRSPLSRRIARLPVRSGAGGPVLRVSLAAALAFLSAFATPGLDLPGLDLPWIAAGALDAQENSDAEALLGELGPAPLVGSVSFTGVQSLDPDQLGNAIATRATECRTPLLAPFCWFTEGSFFQERHRLNRDELSRDELRVQVFYWIRGFRRARANARVVPADDGVEVRFEVDEGPPTILDSLDLEQDTVLLSEGEVDRARLPDPGGPLDMLSLRLGETRLRGALWERGYANAVVEESVIVREGPTPADTARATVRVVVRPGRPVVLDGIRVQGNERVSDRTIRRSLGLSEGDLFRESEMDAARRRLFRSGLFRQSLITTTEDSPDLAEALAGGADDDLLGGGVASEAPRAQPGDTTRTILVIVQEAPFDEVGLGVGMTTLEFGQVQGSYTRYSFLGQARRLDLGATVGNLLAPVLYDRGIFRDAIPRGVVGDEVESAFLDPTWQLSADLSLPWVGSTANSLGFGVFARRRVVPGVVVDRSYGGNASFSRMLTPDVTLGLTYRFERTRTDAGGVYFCVNFGICALSTIDALQRDHQLSPLTLSLDAERVDDPSDPRRGYSVDLSLEHASAATLSDYRYNSAAVEGTLYRSVGPGILSLRARAGWIRASSETPVALGVESDGTDVLHPRTRLYSGGARSVRGYGENQLGPRILTVPSGLLTEADSAGVSVCTVESVADRTCDPNALPSDEFQPRPLGGNRVLEATVEYRYPITENFGVAAFVDAGYVGDLELNIPTGARSAITPGAGVRYRSPAGMIRVDLGVRPTLLERLPVVTAAGDGQDRQLVTLETRKRYDPVGESGAWWEEVVRRLVLHLSIGGPF